MKIIKTEDVPKFKPVTVVFESQAEIDIVAVLLGCLSQQTADKLKIGVDTWKMYNSFHPIASDKEHIDGTLTIDFKGN